MNKYERGSEWQKWDLHVHTKGTQKNDQFTSDSFDNFCVTMFKKALEKDIKAIGITDYFNIEKYERVKRFVNNLDSNTDFSDEEKSEIKTIFILPNVELRMLPVTDSGRLINIHCIFNPCPKFIETLENDFFGSLEDSSNNKMNRNGLISLGKSSGANLSDEIAYNKGVNLFNLEPSKLIELFKSKSKLKENTVVIVSNSSNDGVSALQKHYDIFDGEVGSLDSTRSDIYKLSDAIFSSNPKDRDFFLGKKESSDEQTVIQNCGSLKPCIHGSDAHCEDKLFNPDENRFCWIKADPAFEGLKQIIYEPENRVYIGEKPPVLNKIENNKTKYIDHLTINQTNDHTGDTWFKNIKIPFNKELIAIIGNKGNGKSAIADILGLAGNTHINKKHFSFLNDKKFCKGKLAGKFKSEVAWESGGKSGGISLNEDVKTEKPESVRFIPQKYFEELTNEIEISKFQATLENIIFGYIPDNEKLGKSSFDELKNYKTEIINNDIEFEKSKIKEINIEIIELERKKHPSHIKEIQGFIDEKDIEIKAQNELLRELPKITNPDQDTENKKQQNDDLEQKQNKLDKLKIELHKQLSEKSKITQKYESLKQIRAKIEQQEKLFKEFIDSNKNEAKNYGLDINNILKVTVDYSSVDELIRKTEEELNKLTPLLESVDEIKQGELQENNKNINWKIKIVEHDIQRQVNELSVEQRMYQENEQRKKEINKQIQNLTGNTEHPEHKTLKFYEKEKSFIETELVEILRDKRYNRLLLSINIFNKKKEILKLYDSFKSKVDTQISENRELLENHDIKINTSLNLKNSFYEDFLKYINQNKTGAFYGKEEGLKQIKEILELEVDINVPDGIEEMLKNIIDCLESNKRKSGYKNNISDQVKELDKFYEFLFSLDYLLPKYELNLSDKTLDRLSPGERGALLLIFYLMIDKEDIPLIIDQPEDNLDNESVYNMLSKFIKKAKANRQIIMVTHNPNLAVGADAEQIIHVSLDKQNQHKFSFTSGSIENTEINKKIVKILEGTRPAFDKRRLKYQNNNHL